MPTLCHPGPSPRNRRRHPAAAVDEGPIRGDEWGGAPGRRSPPAPESDDRLSEMMCIDNDISVRLNIWLDEIRTAQGEEAVKAFIDRVGEWLTDTQPNRRLRLHRDHPNPDGWSYRPNPEREPRVFVPHCLCGRGESAPRTITIEGLPPFDASAARPKRPPRHG